MLLRDGTVVPLISGGWSLENVSVDTALDSSQGCCALAPDQAAEMLKGAAGSLVGIGSASPAARALARRYISLLVAPRVSIAAATTAQFRISVVIF